MRSIQRRLRRPTALAISLLAVLVAAPAASAGPAILPTHGAWFGAFVNDTRAGQTAAIEKEVTTFESRIGRKLDIDNRFYTWKQTIPTDVQRWDVANGRIPMISWAGADTLTILSGSQDAWIAAQADRMAALQQPVFLRWYGEMDRRPTLTHTPANFIAAWKHVHDIFVAHGASNVSWVWCTTAWAFTAKKHPEVYYPGSDYVDWVAVDGYNWAPVKPGAQWRTFSQIVTPFYTWAATTAKPLMVAEVGLVEGAPGAKAAWITAAGNDVKTKFPLFRAFVWFDSVATSSGLSYDWRVDTSPQSLAAYIALGADPYFAPPHL
jgi:hypothetical protein